jgi:hypothetical protein
VHAAERRHEMSATNTIEIGSDLWNARVYAWMSLASELAAGLNRPRLWVPSWSTSGECTGN